MSAIFSDELNRLVSTLNPQRAPLPRPTPTRAAALELEKQRAMLRTLSWMPLSGRLANPDGYLRGQMQARRDLETLALGNAREEDRALRLIDLIAMICEEPSWAQNPDAPMEDMARPEIDFFSTDTAALFAWISLLLADFLDARSPRIRGRMLYEARRRVFSPILAHDDYPFMHGAGARATGVACNAMIAAMLMETDVARRNAVLKKLLRLLDRLLGAPYAVAPLQDRLADACALADAAYLVRRMTGGGVDWTRIVPESIQLDEILFSHISGGYFFDPAGSSSCPEISGAAIFRLGRLAGDRDLVALGAAVYRARPLASDSSTGRFLDWMHVDALHAEFAVAPRPAHAALEDGRTMFARGAGFFAALTNGAGGSCTGALSLFLDGSPVLVPDGPGCVPEVAGQARLQIPLSTPAADWEFHADRAIMGVDMTPVYAPGTGVRAHQRTLVLAREEHSVQLVDVFDLERPADIRFGFTTPFPPALLDSGARMGPAELRWEGQPAVEIARVHGSDAFPDGLHHLTLRYENAAPRSMFTFFLTGGTLSGADGHPAPSKL